MVPTLAELDALPASVKGEIIEGVLYTMTRPRARHARLRTIVSGDVRRAFDRGRGRDGSWILSQPGIELPNTPEISPDVAGWRRERLPELPIDEPLRLVPDWVCEILGKTTRRHDLLVKKPYYAKVGVPFHWIVDLDAKSLVAYRLEGAHYVEIGVYAEETDARIEPFESVPFDARSWFT